MQSKRSATVLQSEKRERARLQEQVRHLSAELHQRDAELADTRHKMARSTAEPATAHKRESEVHHRQKVCRSDSVHTSGAQAKGEQIASCGGS